MTDATASRPGAPRRAAPPRPAERARWIGPLATGASFAWLAVVAFTLATMAPEGLRRLATDPIATVVALLGVIVPVALIWLTVAVVQAHRTLRAEADHLRDEIDALREAHAVQARMSGLALRRDLEARIDQASRPAEEAAPAPETRFARREPPLSARIEALKAETAAPPPAARPAPPFPRPTAPVPLAAGATDPDPSGPDLSEDELIRALDLPRSASDEAGFDLLRRALEDPSLAPLLIAAQSWLSRLNEGGPRVDRLDPPPAPAAAWRDWLEGTAARPVLGALADPAAVAHLSGRLADEPDTAEAADAFLDALLVAGPVLAERLGEDGLARLGRTRLGLAARLAGRASGALPSPGRAPTA